jgi:hypothetical protein
MYEKVHFTIYNNIQAGKLNKMKDRKKQKSLHTEKMTKNQKRIYSRAGNQSRGQACGIETNCKLAVQLSSCPVCVQIVSVPLSASCT